MVGDEGLILEERDDGLCLWIEGTGDRRVFALEPGERLDEVLRAIVAWEQFEGMADPPSEEDPVVFPSGPVKRLSDYVTFMRMMQGGDLNSALAKFGLDKGSYARK